MRDDEGGDQRIFLGGIKFIFLRGKMGWESKTSTNWCILVAKLNIPDSLNHHPQHRNACLIQNARRGLEICQTLSFWIKMAKRVWKGGFEEEVEKNGKQAGAELCQAHANLNLSRLC